MKRAVLLAALVATVPAALSAAQVRFDFLKGEDGGCAAYTTYEDETNFMVLMTAQSYQDGRYFLSVKNDNWSIAAGDVIGTITFETDATKVSHNAPITLEHGFLIPLTFSQASDIFVTTGFIMSRNGKEIGTYSGASYLGGWSDLERCRYQLDKAKEEREHQERLDSRDKDPFDD